MKKRVLKAMIEVLESRCKALEHRVKILENMLYSTGVEIPNDTETKPDAKKQYSLDEDDDQPTRLPPVLY